jgi:hypothetical protein
MRPHLPVLDHGRMDPAPCPYVIRINGHLGATMLSAFPALAPHHHGAHTVLTGLLDRSALYGVLAEIEALGLDLLELRKLTPDRESPGSGHHRSPLRPLPLAVSVPCSRNHSAARRCGTGTSEGSVRRNSSRRKSASRRW